MQRGDIYLYEDNPVVVLFTGIELVAVRMAGSHRCTVLFVKDLKYVLQPGTLVTIDIPTDEMRMYTTPKYKRFRERTLTFNGMEVHASFSMPDKNGWLYAYVRSEGNVIFLHVNEKHLRKREE